jgi:hypothetical protein
MSLPLVHAAVARRGKMGNVTKRNKYNIFFLYYQNSEKNLEAYDFPPIFLD